MGLHGFFGGGVWTGLGRALGIRSCYSIVAGIELARIAQHCMAWHGMDYSLGLENYEKSSIISYTTLHSQDA